MTATAELTTVFDPIPRLERDVRDTALLAGSGEIRALVDLYYAMQELRKGTANQARALISSDEPARLPAFFADQMGRLEDQVKSALDKWTEGNPVAEWCRRQHGVGPVITAGLLAHFDIEKAPTVGHFWRFAGLDPSVKWEKGQRRPWNAELKTLCWKLGDSFCKFHNSDDCDYGHLYAQRKQLEVERNDAGVFADQAARTLDDKNIKEKATRERYESGRLPDGEHRAS